MLVKKQTTNAPPPKILKNKTETYKEAFNDWFDFCKISGSSSLYNEWFKAWKSFNAKYIQAIWSNRFKETNIYCPSHYMSINDCINNPNHRDEWIESFWEYDWWIIANCLDIIKLVINKSLMNISHKDMMLDSQLIANEIMYLSSLSLDDRISINEINKRIDEKVLDNIMNWYEHEQTNTWWVLCSWDWNLKQDEDTHNNTWWMKKSWERVDWCDDDWDI